MGFGSILWLLGLSLRFNFTIHMTRTYEWGLGTEETKTVTRNRIHKMVSFDRLDLFY